MKRVPKPNKKAFVNHAVTHLQEYVRGQIDAAMKARSDWRSSAVLKAVADPKVKQLLNALRALGEKPMLTCGDFNDVVSVSFPGRYASSIPLKTHAISEQLKRLPQYMCNRIQVGKSTELRQMLAREFDKFALDAALKNKPFALTLEQFLKHVTSQITTVEA